MSQSYETSQLHNFLIIMEISFIFLEGLIVVIKIVVTIKLEHVYLKLVFITVIRTCIIKLLK